MNIECSYNNVVAVKQCRRRETISGAEHFWLQITGLGLNRAINSRLFAKLMWDRGLGLFSNFDSEILSRWKLHMDNSVISGEPRSVHSRDGQDHWHC